MFSIIGGDFGEKGQAYIVAGIGGEFKLLVVGRHKFPPTRIVTAEKVDETNKASVMRAATGAGVGALLAGPIGLLLGGMVGASRKQSTLCLIGFDDGRQLLASCPPDEFFKLKAVAMRPKPKKKKKDWSFLKEPDENEDYYDEGDDIPTFPTV